MNVTVLSEFIEDEIVKIHKDATVQKRVVEKVSVLPVGSVNISKDSTFRSNYKQCKTFEGSFKIPQQVWDKIFIKGSLDRMKYPYVIKQYLKSVNNTCIFNIKNSRITKCILYIYGYCGHKTCKKSVLKMLFSNKAHIFHVYSSDKNYSHDIQLTSQVRGVERSLLRKKLSLIKPSTFSSTAINITPSSLIDAGNLGQIKSDSVFRKLRSESLALGDRNKDDIIDMFLMPRENREYIASVGYTFYVNIFSIEQLLLAKMAISLILYLDATWRVARQMEYIEKRLLYYAGVVRLPNNQVCPIFEMVSSSHDAFSIGKWLIDFKNFAVKHKFKWPFFRRVVIDVSYALLNAANYFWVQFLRYSKISQLLLRCFYIESRQGSNYID